MAKRKREEEEKKCRKFEKETGFRFVNLHEKHTCEPRQFFPFIYISMAVGKNFVSAAVLVFVVKEIESDWWHIHFDC